ncbi:MAG: SAVED domain-containing protein [Desulfobulbaceae bacterium]|nr:SAVED domain-containing protein [Desulfobulbaceae bacterium]
MNKKVNVLNLLWQFWNQWLKYRNVDPIIGFARLLVGLGVGLIAPGGVWWLMVALEIRPEKLPVSLTFSFGPETVTYTGLILLAIGVSLGIWGVHRVRKTRSCCLIYMRGMPGMHDQPPFVDLPPRYRFGEVTHFLLDSHNRSPQDVLQDIEMLRKMLDDKILSMNIEAPIVIFAGLAPVPLLYATGVCLLNRSNLKVMDYNRFEQKWHMLDDLDDGDHLKILYPKCVVGTEIAIAISFTLLISKSQLPPNFRDKTIWIYLNKSEPKADALSSEEKLKRVLRELHDMIRNLRSRKGYEDVGKIHLFVAAQSSTVFKLGTEFQANVYPDIRIYHFNGGEGKYTWGVSVKNNKIEVVEASS